MKYYVEAKVFDKDLNFILSVKDKFDNLEDANLLIKNEWNWKAGEVFYVDMTVNGKELPRVKQTLIRKSNSFIHRIKD